MQGRCATLLAPTGPAVSDLLIALGGRANVEAVESRAGRLCVTIREAAAVDLDRLDASGLRGAAMASATSVHLLSTIDPEALAEGLRALLGPELR